MSFLLVVAAEGERIDGPLRLCRLPARKEADISELEIDLPEASNRPRRNSDSSYGVERTTVLVIEMKHHGQLPDSFGETMAVRAYDYAASQGVHMKSADPRSCVSGLALEVKG